MYKTQRNYENINKALYKGVGQYGIPGLYPVHNSADNWIGFNYAKGCEEPEQHGIHFYLDDYQFIRLWTNPGAYVDRLRKFQAVCTPDFSMYTDFPKAVQIFNHYRKHWLGKYWQENGVRIIPTIGWSDESSYDWCFDGEPKYSTVIVSSVGTQKDPTATRLFLLGYKEMLKRLEPEKIYFYGNVPDECEGNIVHIKPFQQKWREKNSQKIVKKI